MTSRPSWTGRRTRRASWPHGHGAASSGADRDAPTAHRKVVDAFLAAAHSGDFEGLLAVLDPDVVLHADDGSGALQLVKGAREVATRAQFFSAHRVAHPAMIDGASGFVATEAGQPVSVLAFTIVDGRITAIDALQGPARLAGLGLEAFVGGPGDRTTQCFAGSPVQSRKRDAASRLPRAAHGWLRSSCSSVCVLSQSDTALPRL